MSEKAVESKERPQQEDQEDKEDLPSSTIAHIPGEYNEVSGNDKNGTSFKNDTEDIDANGTHTISAIEKDNDVGDGNVANQPVELDAHTEGKKCGEEEIAEGAGEPGREIPEESTNEMDTKEVSAQGEPQSEMSSIGSGEKIQDGESTHVDAHAAAHPASDDQDLTKEGNGDGETEKYERKLQQEEDGTDTSTSAQNSQEEGKKSIAQEIDIKENEGTTSSMQTSCEFASEPISKSAPSQHQQHQSSQPKEKEEQPKYPPPDDKESHLLQKIASLKDERDQAYKLNEELLRQLKESNEPPSKTNEKDINSNDKNSQEESKILLSELQSMLQTQMALRDKEEKKMEEVMNTLHQYEAQLNHYSSLEDEVESLQANLIQVVADKSKIETEVSKLRESREDFERKEAVLHNRLNEAKKKEANKTNLATRLENENEALRKELIKVKEELVSMTTAKEHLDSNLEKIKKKCIDRVKASENSLQEERNLNNERKKKIMVFVETKAEELRAAKAANDELAAELDQTVGALQSVREKLELASSAQLAAQNRNRDLLREVNRMKKNSEQLHQMEDKLELELHRSAQETEEHKNKRLTAKHELMSMLRKLEAEQAVSGKLRDSVKFTFTPKALSQQQLLTESLKDFEDELGRLARRLGKPVPPSDFSMHGDDIDGDVGGDGALNGDRNGNIHLSGHGGAATSGKGKGNSRANTRAEWDTARLLSNLESETQKVSKGILKLTSCVDRLHIILDDDGERNCVSAFNAFLQAHAATKGASVNNSLNDNGTNPVLSPKRRDNEYSEEEDGSFAGVSHGNRKHQNERYGLVDSNGL